MNIILKFVYQHNIENILLISYFVSLLILNDHTFITNATNVTNVIGIDF